MIKKAFNVKKLLNEFIGEKLNVFNQLQIDFSQSSWLTYFDKNRIWYADINVFKIKFKMIVCYCKKNKNEKMLSIKRNVDFILFLNKVFSQTKNKYWFMKLKMTDLIWIACQIAHFIKFFKHFTIIYTNHETNVAIMNQIKFNIINIDKLNMKLIRIFIHFVQFKIKIKHKFEKINIISKALNKLFTKTTNFKTILNESKIAHHTKNEFLIQLNSKFKKNLIQNYTENKSWAEIKAIFINFNDKLIKKFDSSKTIHINIEFKMQNNLIYHIKNDFVRFCILTNAEKQMFEKTHDKNMHVKHAKIYKRLFKIIQKIKTIYQTLFNLWF